MSSNNLNFNSDIFYSQISENDQIQISFDVDQRIGQKITSSSSGLIGNKLSVLIVKLMNLGGAVDYNVYGNIWDRTGKVKSVSEPISIGNIGTQFQEVTFNFPNLINIENDDVVGVSVDGGLFNKSSVVVRVNATGADENSKLWTWRNGQWFADQFGGVADMYLKAFSADDKVIEVPKDEIIPQGFHRMPDGTIMADDKMYTIELDGKVRLVRLGAVEYTEIRVNPNEVQDLINRGIGRLLTEKEKIPIVTISISSEVQAILTKFDNNDYTFPSWFNSNIGFVKDGSITSNEFLNAFNNLLQAGTIIDKTIIITYCVNVYTLDSGGNVLSDHYDSINVTKFQQLTNEGKYVFLCEDGIIPSEQQVRNFYGYTAPVADSSINTTMVSQSVGAFILKDGRLKGEILYIANTAFNPFYYNKNLTSLVQIKSKTGVPIAAKPNNLNFTNTQRDERIQIDEAVGNFKELIVDFFVWKSTTDMRAFTANKQIQVVEELPTPDEPDFKPCQIGFHKDFSGKCVPDDPIGEIPRDKLIDTLKGFLFGTVALSLLARKY